MYFSCAETLIDDACHVRLPDAISVSNERYNTFSAGVAICLVLLLLGTELRHIARLWQDYRMFPSICQDGVAQTSFDVLQQQCTHIGSVAFIRVMRNYTDTARF